MNVKMACHDITQIAKVKVEQSILCLHFLFIGNKITGKSEVYFDNTINVN